VERKTQIVAREGRNGLIVEVISQELQADFLTSDRVEFSF
jgi:hypothetical protein